MLWLSMDLWVSHGFGHIGYATGIMVWVCYGFGHAMGMHEWIWVWKGLIKILIGYWYE